MSKSRQFGWNLSKVTLSTDAGQVSALVLLDLSAAFDTVDHRILLDVSSSRFGVNNHVYDWFHSYLSSRTQIFSTLPDTSNAVALICSIPQGSVVGSLLFIAYTEDVEDLIQTFLSRTTYMQMTPSCSHICYSQRCCDTEEILRDVWVKSKIGALRNGYNKTQTKPK